MAKFKMPKKVWLLISLFLIAGLADALTTGYLWTCNNAVVQKVEYTTPEGTQGCYTITETVFAVERNGFYFPFLSTFVLLPSALACLYIGKYGLLGWGIAGFLLCVAWTGAVNNLFVLCSIIFY